MKLNLVVVGIGGQGVIYVTKVLSQAGLLCGEHILASENHGMSQRGGSVMAYVKIGSGEAPLIRRGTADTLIALDEVEAMRNLPYVGARGRVCVNGAGSLAPALAARLDELGIKVHAIDADGLARQLGAPAAANLVVLGHAAACGALGFTTGQLRAAVQALGPTRTLELNFRALELGAAQAAGVPAAAA